MASRLKWLEPLRSEKERVALASGSVALNSPAIVPAGWFSEKFESLRTSAVGAALATELESSGSEP